MAEIKELRKQAMRKRQLAPASAGSKGSTKARRMLEVSTGADTGQASGVAPDGGGKEAFAVEVDHPEAWEWYLKAAAGG